MQRIFSLLNKTTNALGINLNTNSGIEIKFNKIEMAEDEYKIIIDLNKIHGIF